MGKVIISISIIVLAAAIYFHAQTGRYQITTVENLAGVYRVDTRTGQLAICSPLYADSCTAIEDVKRIMDERKAAALAAAGKVGNKIDNFTKSKALDLRNAVGKIGGSRSRATPPTSK